MKETKHPEIEQVLSDHMSVALIAHDAGAAAHIAAWFSSTKKELHIYAEGPAKEIFIKTFKQKIETSLMSAIKKSTIIVTGTGWQSTLEHHARQIAHKCGLPSVGVIDHWVNYQERFIRNNEEQLPGSIWVADSDAEVLARKIFKGLPIIKLSNKWLDNVTQNVNNLRSAERNKKDSKGHHAARRLLYFLEPIREPWIKGTTNIVKTEIEAGEFQALRFWLENISKLVEMGWVASKDELISLTLRPHPSEPLDKYNAFVAEYEEKWPIRINHSDDLEVALVNADAVFGCNTQALVAAMACGIPTFSTVPPWGKKCCLPQDSLNHLSLFI